MRRCGFEMVIALIVGSLCMESPDWVFASDAGRAERFRMMRDMTTVSSSGSSGSSDSSVSSSARVNARLSNDISTDSAAYNAVYNSEFVNKLDESQMVYEEGVQTDLKRKQLANASGEQSFLASLTTPYEEEGNRVQGRVIAEENAYLKLLASEEKEKRLRELEKEKKEKEEEVPQRALLKEEIPAKKERVEETESLSDTEKQGIISRMVFLEFDPSYAASIVNTLNSKKEIHQFLLSGESPERLNGRQVDWVVEGT